MLNIQTKEGLFETQLKNAIVKMINDDPQFEGMTVEDAIICLDMDGKSLEDYIEMNTSEFGQAMTAVTFDFLGGDSLADLVRGE